MKNKLRIFLTTVFTSYCQNPIIQIGFMAASAPIAWEDGAKPVRNASSVHDLYLVFRGNDQGGKYALFNLGWWKFIVR